MKSIMFYLLINKSDIYILIFIKIDDISATADLIILRGTTHG